MLALSAARHVIQRIAIRNANNAELNRVESAFLGKVAAAIEEAKGHVWVSTDQDHDLKTILSFPRLRISSGPVWINLLVKDHRVSIEDYPGWMVKVYDEPVLNGAFDETLQQVFEALQRKAEELNGYLATAEPGKSGVTGA